MRYTTVRPLILPGVCAAIGACCLWLGAKTWGWSLIACGAVLLVIG